MNKSTGNAQISRSAVYQRARALSGVAEPQPAHADSPVLAGVMTAALGAVCVTGLAVVVVTLEGKKGGKAVEVQPSGDDGTSGDTHDPGTTGETGGTGGNDGPSGSGGGTGGSGNFAGPVQPSSGQTVGDESLPAEVRGFLHRNVHATASPVPSTASGTSGEQATAIANYRFDGDVRQATAFTRFGFQDSVILRFEISRAAPPGAPMTVRVDDLVLSTADVTETHGHAAVEFRAVQGDDVLWTWSARVDQGKTPQISGAAGTAQRIVRQDKDLLIIRGLEAPLTYKAPDANGTTTVDIIMAVDAAGAKR
jgi:hypothetical protein